MKHGVSRRDVLRAGGGVLATALSAGTGPSAEDSSTAQASAFRYCLNTSTIRGQKLGIVDEVEIAAKAGYDGVEPWLRELEQYVGDGGSLKDLAKRIRDLGLTVDSAIGFAKWIVDDDAERRAGLEQAKRDMDLVRQIGGTRIAAPPAGATGQADLNLLKAAERYRALLEVGDELGVVPQVEVWGFSKALSRLGETMFVALESRHERACLLPDVYHLYKGGSDFSGLKLLGAQAFHVLHLNDYPRDPPRDQIADAHRVYPGDGVAPLETIFGTLRQIGFRGTLSLELFNPEYWKQDALAVAKTGLKKMKAAAK
jgi:sugar phosphate isomerase/epimerase